ncbi:MULTISPECIES: Panacea domain-containing protein [Leptospira]|uniref:Antitoxin SocA-like Panacea domain-containing protein n=1 Tax=Leptospira kirschneri serovar Pomona TaxID=561005 RepID=A0A1T1E1Z2_9LEPT|nr:MULTISPECIES: Panacea domain-containing protein [Leptospira]EMO82124.1 PF13274 family protein [Leptospira kirschneri str. 200801774]OOV47117.1 hypothetical protein B1J93_01960 [Leptospira kirschneri serovar Pomona]TQE69882.1 DUF4065 domain-containing protein [Leptospira noguchii]UOG30892.1 SocA family protein [Leptospira noguchii]UOG53043.1 SocA family protein [Leptospira noguchii]
MQKYEAITIFLLEHISDLSQTKWNKLLFFVDGAAQSYLSQQITDLKYIKLPYGPVPFDYSNKIQSMHYNKIIKREAVNGSFDNKIFIKKTANYEDQLLNVKTEFIDSNQILIIQKVIEVFKTWTANLLSDFSHELDAWKIPKMYSDIDLNTLKNDNYLKKKYNEPNFGNLLIKQ